VDTLLALVPRVPPGGFMAMDDYFCVAAAARAVDAFRIAHGVGSGGDGREGARASTEALRRSGCMAWWRVHTRVAAINATFVAAFEAARYGAALPAEAASGGTSSRCGSATTPSSAPSPSPVAVDTAAASEDVEFRLVLELPPALILQDAGQGAGGELLEVRAEEDGGEPLRHIAMDQRRSESLGDVVGRACDVIVRRKAKTLAAGGLAFRDREGCVAFVLPWAEAEKRRAPPLATDYLGAPL